MKRINLSFIVLPLLFIIVYICSYWAIKNKWNFELVSFFIFIFTIIYISIFEQIIPLKNKWKPQKQILWVDIAHFIFSTVLFDALGKTLSLYLVLWIQKHFFDTSYLWQTLPLWITFVIANIIGDFFPYVYHRISHKGNKKSFFSLLLWKIHAVHHLPTSMNWLKTNWIHPINILLNTLFKMTPILILGFSSEVIFLVGITHVIIAYISHANIFIDKSFWDYIIVTPHIHHFHHSNQIKEAKNYGNTFPLWDLVFGTYYNRKGIVKNVGIINSNTSKYPTDKEYLKQLLLPVMTSKECCTK